MRNSFIMLAWAALAWSPVVVAQPAQNDAASGAGATAADPEALAKIAAVQRHVDAYRSGQLDRFVATFTADAEVHANGLIAVGHAEIRALYALNFTQGAPNIRIHDSGLAGEFVYLSVGYVLASGEEMCCSYSEYEITDGKVSYLASSG